MKNIMFYIAIGVYAFSCNEHPKETEHQKHFKLTSELIQACIDSTNVLDSAINTKTFYVDLELLRKIDPVAVQQYLFKHSDINLTNLDSLKRNKSSWLKNEFPNNEIIVFRKADHENDSIILFETEKARFIDASFGTEIRFKKMGNRFSCIESKITWIE